MRTDSGGSVSLVRFTARDNGIATGKSVGKVGFMALRFQRTPDWTLDHLDPEDPAAEVSTTTLKPWRVPAASLDCAQITITPNAQEIS